jgi:hypothetical protein
MYIIPTEETVPHPDLPPIIHTQRIVWVTKHPKFQIRVNPPGGTEKVFDVDKADKAAILEALHYNDTWKYARMWALYRMWRLAVEYTQAQQKIDFSSSMNDEYSRQKSEDKERFSQVRQDVFLLIQICCFQEGELVAEFMKNIQAEILTDPMNQVEPTWVWKTWPECL